MSTLFQDSWFRSESTKPSPSCAWMLWSSSCKTEVKSSNWPAWPWRLRNSEAAASYRCVSELCMLLWEIHNQSSRTERWEACRKVVHHHINRRLDVCQDVQKFRCLQYKGCTGCNRCECCCFCASAVKHAYGKHWFVSPDGSSAILDRRIVRTVIIVTVCHDM